MPLFAGLAGGKPKGAHHSFPRIIDRLFSVMRKSGTVIDAACGFALVSRLRYVSVVLMDSGFQIV
jgi:hypothetical protein